MRANNDDYWYRDYDEDESGDEEAIILNYEDFFKRQNKSSLWSPIDKFQDKNCEFDESNSQRHNNCGHQYYIPGSESQSVARGKHSCLILKDGYCYLDPSVYDTRVMRNLTTMDNDLPCGSYSPKFIQAALEKTRSLTSLSDDGQINDLMHYNNRQMQNFDGDYCGYTLTKQPQRRISQAARHSDTGLRTMVENLIYNTQVVIFSKTYCPYCDTAKGIFNYMEQPYAVIELDQRADGDEIQGIMEQITGGTSVPRVFLNGIFIGGGNEVKRLYDSGALQEMLDFE